ncbi:IPT/TIG domain-containing protein [Sulfuriferula sp.]|uniref:IPT/TIG domain-containing protein n=1 Tax=Sulfuriferula sp. TaxID=2025307 RepID=UPI00272FCC9A|nr:IPT/TIG domain-containing protein [Sulfuriferula sp.]MDP2027070.1 IPT/TIG domain-containing protein [Sulfuriferula sp.]
MYATSATRMTTLLGILLVVFTSSIMAAGGRASGGRSNTTPPVVVSVSVTTNNDQMIIRGSAFGSQPLQVLLGNQRLGIKQSGEQEIIAQLPSNVSPAAYRLIVERDGDLQSQPFTVHVMAN